MKAIENGDTSVVAHCLANGADPNIRNLAGDSALYLATLMDQVEAAQLLLEAGADPNAPIGTEAEDVEYPLHSAAMSSSPAMIGLLLEHGADINRKASNLHPGLDGRTPLMSVCFRRPNAFDEVLCVLLDNGADVNAVDTWGQTPLMHLAHNARFRVMATRFSDFNGATIDRLGEILGEIIDTSLEVAADRLKTHGPQGGLDLVVRFLEAGADINARDYWAMTPRMHARIKRDEQTDAVLATHGGLFLEEDGCLVEEYDHTHRMDYPLYDGTGWSCSGNYAFRPALDPVAPPAGEPVSLLVHLGAERGRYRGFEGIISYRLFDGQNLPSPWHPMEQINTDKNGSVFEARILFPPGTTYVHFRLHSNSERIDGIGLWTVQTV